jgi:hypothetical protein
VGSLQICEPPPGPKRAEASIILIYSISTEVGFRTRLAWPGLACFRVWGPIVPSRRPSRKRPLSPAHSSRQSSVWVANLVATPL